MMNFPGFRQSDREEEALRTLKIGDRIFLRTDNSDYFEQSGEITLFEHHLSVPKVGKDPELYLVCSNMKGTNLEMCTEERLNDYSFIGLFEVLPKISASEDIPIGTVTKDQLSFSIGKEVKYGDRIVLRHVYSGGNLMPNQHRPGVLYGSWELQLEPSTYVDTEFVPCNQNKSLGDVIHIGEPVSIMFTSQTKKYFLNSSEFRLSKWKPSAYSLSGNWTIKVFENGWVDHSSIHYGSSMMIKGYGLSLKLSKMTKGKKREIIEDPTQYAFLTSKESSHNLWMLERWVEDCPNTMQGGEVSYNDRVYIRNLASKDYLSKDLRLIELPSAEDYFVIVKSSNELNNKLGFGTQIILKNADDLTVCINEKSYIQESLSKIMPQSDEFSVAVNKCSAVELSSSEKSSFCLFEISRPSPVAEQLIRELNLIVPFLREFSDYVKTYGHKQSELESIANLFNPETGFLYLNDMIEEVVAVIQRLGSLIVKKTDIDKCNYIQYFMYKMKIHRAAFRLINSLAKRLSCPEEFIITLDQKHLNSLQEVANALWTFLELASENNAKVCKKMARKIHGIVSLTETFPMYAGNFIAMILEESYPDIENFDGFARVVLEKLRVVDHKKLEFDTCCLRIAQHSIIFNSEVIFTHQETINNILIELGNYFPFEFFTENAEVMIRFKTLDEVDVTHLLEMNQPLNSIVKGISQDGFCVPVKTLVLNKEYTNFITEYLKLYRSLCIGLPILSLNQSYSQIGIKKNWMVHELLDDELIPLTLKKELISISVSMLITAQVKAIPSKLCVPLNMDEAPYKDKNELIHLGQNKEHLMELILMFWNQFSSTFSEKSSEAEVLFLISLLENSLSLAQSDLCELNQLEIIALNTAKFLEAFMHTYDNEGETTTKKLFYHERVLKNSLALLSIYSELKFIEIGESIVYSILVNPMQSAGVVKTFTNGDEIEMLAQEEINRRETEDFEKMLESLSLPDFTYLFDTSIAQALIKVLVNANKIDQNLHLRTVKTLQVFYTTSKHFFKIFSKMELYRPLAIDKYQELIEECKQKLSNSKLKNSLKEGNYFEKMRDLKDCRRYIGKLIELIDIRKKDKYKIFHLQNLMRNYSIFDIVASLWKIISNYEEDLQFENKKQKTLKTFVAFTYAFINKNEINQKAIKNKFTYGFYDSIGLLAAVTQQVTRFSHLSGAMTRNFIKVLIDNFLFSGSKTSPSALKWLIALIFKIPSECSKENQAIISELLFLKMNKHVKHWDEIQDKESTGETLYLLSFCCINNSVIRIQCDHFIGNTVLLKIIKEENEFSLKRGALALLFKIYVFQHDPQFVKELTDACSVLIDYFIENLHSIKVLAGKGAYELIAPKKISYRVEVNHSSDFHSDILHMCWTVACKEYTYGYTGLIFYLQQTTSLKSPEILEKLNLLRKRLEITFTAEYYIQEFIEELTKTISVMENQSEITHNFRLSAFTISTKYNNVQYWNSIFSRVVEKMHTSYAQKDKSFAIRLNDSIIEELPHFSSLEKGKIREDEKLMVLKFFKYFMMKSTTVCQISVFYLFLTNLFSRCKKKRVVSEILIESGLIGQALCLIQEINTPKLQLIALKFLSTISSQNSTIIKDYILEKLKRLDTSYALFTYILNSLRSTTNSLMNYNESEEDVFKFKLSRGFLKLLASLCDNCNSAFQEFMLEQTYDEESALKNISMVQVVFEMVADLTQSPNLISSERQIKVILRHALDTLIEFTTGPCVKNQEFLLNNIQTYLIINSLLSVKNNQREKEDKLLYKNTVNLLSVITEQDPVFPDKMAKYLDIPLILQQITKLYNGITEQFEVRDSRKLSMMIASTMEDIELNKDTQMLLHSAVMLVIFVIRFESVFPDHVEIQGMIKRDQCDYSRNALLFKLMNIQNDFMYQDEKPDEKPEITYFKNFIASVEIQRDDKIHKHYFQLPYRWRFLTQYSAESLIESVDHSSRVGKLEQLMESIPFIERELKHQQRLRRRKWLHRITNKWKLFGIISYVLLVVINIVLLFRVTEVGEMQSIFSNDYNSLNFLLNVSSSLQILLISLCVGGFAFEYYPVLVLKSEHRIKGKVEISDLLITTGTVLASRNQRLQSHDQKSIRKHIKTLSKVKRLYYLFKNGHIFYHTVYLIVAMVSLFYPFYYPILLLDIMKRSPTLRDLFKAITTNGKQLILASIVGIITIYIFGTIGFLYLSHNFEASEDSTAEFFTFCDDLWECSVSTFYMGFRLGGGIGDALVKKDLNADADGYYSRVAYDLLFFVLINVIFMNIIFGIIIDTFAQLRDIRSEQDYNRENVCFICHNKRTFFELHGEGFVNHTIETHNVWAYIFFFCYLNDVRTSDCTGIEKYVKQCLKKEQIDFFPDNSKFLKENDFNPENSK